MRLIWLLLGIQILIWHGDCRKLDSEQSQAMLGIMLRTLRLEAGDSRTERMDPLLRELMVTALQRSQDERDRDNLTPPRYRQDPLLRQLMDNVVDTFADMVLELPPRAQDHLLRVLREEGMTDREIAGLLPPASRQDPLLRELMSEVMEIFLESLTPPSSRQNPLLRQLAETSLNEAASNISPPVYRQNPLLRQLSSGPADDTAQGLSTPLFRQDITGVERGQGKMTFDTLMKAIKLASEMMDKSIQTPDDGILSLSPPQDQTRPRPGNIDFSSDGKLSESGQLCVTQEDLVKTVETDPVLECSHGQQEKCHVSYVTFYEPSHEQVCRENFEKSCQISFSPEASQETVEVCSKPLQKICNGQGEQICRIEYETSCSTRQVEVSPGKRVGETKCEKIPVDICGRGCVTMEAKRECHEEQVDTVVEVPHEFCDIIPHKVCSQATKLVPQLKPSRECTMVPTEVCTMNYNKKKIVEKPLKTEWCLDPEDVMMEELPQYRRDPL